MNQQTYACVNHDITIDPDKPFENDLFGNRKKMATKLTDIVENSLAYGGVVSLEAPWGEGKTTFLDMWVQSLNNKDTNYPVIQFNAYKHDYKDEPFLAIAKELYSHVKSSDWGKTKAVALKADIIEFVKKTGIKAVDFSLNMATAGAASSPIESILSDYLDNDSLESEIEKFRHSLDSITSELFKRNKGPLVFIIDELDRCRPSFALELIEKIKHTFDVSNVVWVLSMNREQMEESIRNVYGTNVDAHIYLNKFITIPLILKRPSSSEKGTLPWSAYYKHYYLELFLNYVGNELKFGCSGEAFSPYLCDLSHYLSPSPREMQKIVERIVNVQRARESYLYNKGLSVLMCSLYIMNKGWYNKLKFSELKTEDTVELFKSLKIIHPSTYIIRMYAALRLALHKRPNRISNIDFTTSTNFGWDTYNLPLQGNTVYHLDEFKKANHDFVQHLDYKNLLIDICSLIETNLLEQ